VRRLRGGLVFKARRLCVLLNSRFESNTEEEGFATSASERRGNNLNAFEDFYLKAKALTVLFNVPYSRDGVSVKKTRHQSEESGPESRENRLWLQVSPLPLHCVKSLRPSYTGFSGHPTRGCIPRASERRENNLKALEDFYLKAKALTVLLNVPYSRDGGSVKKTRHQSEESESASREKSPLPHARLFEPPSKVNFGRFFNIWR